MAHGLRAAFGELIQWDSSVHAWFEDRVPGRFVLIKLHDDATNRLLMARFVPVEDGAANRQIVIDYLRRWGRPVPRYARCSAVRAFFTLNLGGVHTRPWRRRHSSSSSMMKMKKGRRTISLSPAFISA